MLNHFADDVVFTSPVAVQLLANRDGVIRGKVALRAYWQEGLRRPLLGFVGSPRRPPLHDRYGLAADYDLVADLVAGMFGHSVFGVAADRGSE